MKNMIVMSFLVGEEHPRTKDYNPKLTNKALKTFPNSPKQKEVRKEIDALRKEMGMKVNEDLRKWFKDKWVRFGSIGKIREEIVLEEVSEGKPNVYLFQKHTRKKGCKKHAEKEEKIQQESQGQSKECEDEAMRLHDLFLLKEYDDSEKEKQGTYHISDFR